MDCSKACLDTVELEMSSSASHDIEAVRELCANIRLSDLYNFPGESLAMTPEISSAMRAGNKDFLEKMKTYKTPMACFKNDKGDSILHVAASFGHLELVESIVSQCPSLLLEPNWKDRIPLHVAARAGHLATVKVLVALIACFSAKLPDENKERLNLYVVKDINGDTPLHLALKELQRKTELLKKQHNRNQGSMRYRIQHWRGSSLPKYITDTITRMRKTIFCLVSANQCVSFLANEEGISPLYLVVKLGCVALVKAMLRDKSYNLALKLEGRKSLAHIALKALETDILDIILSEDPNLVNEKDEEGRTCLSVGASKGFYEGICNLLDRSTSGIFECNDDGSFPIHKAVEEGYSDIVKEFLKRCPDSLELLNKDGQNILHIAAKNGTLFLFLLDYIRRLGTKNHLVEEKDVDGNTPLHLATIKWRPITILSLTKFLEPNTYIMDIQNKAGLRPLDIAQIKLQPDYILRERMTLMVLLCAYKPRDVSWIPTSGMTLRSRLDQNVANEKFKDRVNILLLVAALVATMTFAAGFTLPGGFNSSTPNIGMAILVEDGYLTYFLVCDTLAMQFSLVAIVALIWAQLGDQELAHKAFHLALPSLFFSLCCMSLAFAYGVQATIKENKALTKATTVIFGILSGLMIFLLTPYVIPQLHGIPFLQPFSDIYLRGLLILVNEDDADKLYTSDSVHPKSGFLKRLKKYRLNCFKSF